MLFLDAYISPLEKEIPFQSQAGFFGRSPFPSPFLSPPSLHYLCLSVSLLFCLHTSPPPPPPQSPTQLLRLPSSGAAARYFTPLMSQCLFPPRLFVSSPSKKLSAWQSDWGPRRVLVFFFLPTRFLCQGGLIFFFFF